MKAVGINGQVEFTGDRIIITRKGLMASASHGSAGEVEIPLRSIASVQLRKPSLFSRSFIQFIYSGGAGPAANIDQAAEDIHAVIVSKKQFPQFEEIKNAVLEAIS